jgi:sentrin-specific protease 1
MLHKVLYYNNIYIILILLIFYSKVWVQNSKPYSIKLSLKKLQEILKEDQPMELNCFNLAVRKFMLDNYDTSKKSKRTISKHYLDMQFWVCSNIHNVSTFTRHSFLLTFSEYKYQEITDYGRHPNFRKNFIEERLAECINSWPGINYSVSRCKSVRLNFLCLSTITFVLF